MGFRFPSLGLCQWLFDYQARLSDLHCNREVHADTATDSETCALVIRKTCGAASRRGGLSCIGLVVVCRGADAVSNGTANFRSLREGIARDGEGRSERQGQKSELVKHDVV